MSNLVHHDQFTQAIDGVSMLFSGFIIGYVVKSAAEMIDLIKQYVKKRLQ